MRFDGAGGELRGFDFFHLLLRDATFHLAREWKRNIGTGLGLRVGEATIEIVRIDGCELGAIAGDQLDSHIDDGDGLIAIVGDDEKDGQESVIGEIDGENFGFLGIVVGIGGDGDLFVAMEIMGRIVECSLCDRLHKALAGDQQNRNK